MSRMITLTALVLRHLKDNKTITTYEAFTEYGATRLSAIIFELRKKHLITDEWVERQNRYGENVRFKRYIYKKEIKNGK